MDGSKTVSLKDVPLVFCGYGVKAPERKWDDFKGVDLKGKIMVVLVNDPDYETGQGDFGGKADNLLRPLDLQVRGRRAPGRGGRVRDPRNRPGLVRLADRAQFQHQRAVRHRARRSEIRAHDRRSVDPARSGRRSVQESRPGFREAEETGADARLQTGRAQGHDVLGQLQRRPETDRLAQHRRRSRKAASGRTNTSSTPRTGIISASARRMQKATKYTMAQSTTRPAPPR